MNWYKVAKGVDLNDLQALRFYVTQDDPGVCRSCGKRTSHPVNILDYPYCEACVRKCPYCNDWVAKTKNDYTHCPHCRKNLTYRKHPSRSDDWFWVPTEDSPVRTPSKTKMR